MIVTGFLGSGKTTFINQLLQQNEGVKIGLIENEFGEVPLDTKLLANYQSDYVFELPNGCICCSIFNEFSLTLQELVKRHDHLEQLIIETTGLADPGPIIEPFFQDPDLVRLFEYRGTICLIDSVNFLKNKMGAKQLKQIILSDMIVLNKISEVDQKVIELIRKKVNALNQTAVVVETNYAFLESLHLYMLQPNLHDEFVKKLKKPFYSESAIGGYHSFSIRFGGLLHEDRFRDWFIHFAWLHRENIFRIKGLVHFNDNPLQGIVQSVGGAASITEGSVINPFIPLENVLVFIGKDVSKYVIEKEIQQFLLQEN